MKFIKQSERTRPKVSLILLDWSVRESFHLLDYLRRQDVDRDLFEVIIIEYYARVSDAISPFADQVDSWLLLEMPGDCYYHKHLMYNAGIVAAKGDICVICDSDAMVKEGFIRAIITEFERNQGIVLHIDQFRNARKDLYPFCYPDFSQITGKGCLNNVAGKTRGIVDGEDPIHTRNYGACMCARRMDLIAIGGADEHFDYLGHICGPYDMTFRLVNFGHREIWHQTEFMYHSWHPGQAGEDNYLGPHDGRHISTTALDALISDRTMPLIENQTVRNLRLCQGVSPDLDLFHISPKYLTAWRKDNIRRGQEWITGATTQSIWNGIVMKRTANGYVAFPKLAECPDFLPCRGELEMHASSERQIRKQMARSLPLFMRWTFPVLTLVAYIYRAAVLICRYSHRGLGRMMRASQA